MIKNPVLLEDTLDSQLLLEEQSLNFVVFNDYTLLNSYKEGYLICVKALSSMNQDLINAVTLINGLYNTIILNNGFIGIDHPYFTNPSYNLHSSPFSIDEHFRIFLRNINNDVIQYIFPEQLPHLFKNLYYNYYGNVIFPYFNNNNISVVENFFQLLKHHGIYTHITSIANNLIENGDFNVFYNADYYPSDSNSESENFSHNNNDIMEL